MTDIQAAEPQTMPSPVEGRNVAILDQQGEVMRAMDAKHMVLIDSIINWAIANPGKPWTKCAAALGFTPHWVRLVVGTDAFRARYAQVAPQLLKEVGIASLQDRIRSATETVVERIEEKAQVSESLGDLTDAAETLLSYQFGGGGQKVGQPSTTITVNQTIINEERGRLLEGKKA